MTKTPRKKKTETAPPAAVLPESTEARFALNRQWVEDRQRTLGLSVAALAEALGTYPNMVWRIMSGARRVTPQEICTLAGVLRVPVTVLMRRWGFDVPSVSVPVIGEVNAAGRVSTFPAGQGGEVPSPDDSRNELVALRVRSAESAYPLFDGYHFFYEPGQRVEPGAFGRLSVLELGTHTAPIVGVLDKTSVTRVSVAVWGLKGAERVEDYTLVSAKPVLWMRAF